MSLNALLLDYLVRPDQTDGGYCAEFDLSGVRMTVLQVFQEG